jgi:hypothetical protein
MNQFLIYHQGSLTGHRMAYVGGDIFFTVPDLDADRFNIWHLNSVLETYLDYPYNNFPNLFYKYDEESNEQIHGLLPDNDFKTMLKGLLNGKRSCMSL